MLQRVGLSRDKRICNGIENTSECCDNTDSSETYESPLWYEQELTFGELLLTWLIEENQPVSDNAGKNRPAQLTYCEYP